MAKPLLGQVKIIPIEIPEEVTSSGGIILTRKSKQICEVQCNVGTIVELGPLAFKGTSENPNDEPQFKVGDTVYFVKHAGSLIQKKGGKPPERIIDWRDVKAEVEEDDDLLGL